jgi:hypothetical protein
LQRTQKDFPNLPKKHAFGTRERGAFAGECPSGIRGKFKSGETNMTLFKNTVSLRGYLDSDAAVPAHDEIGDDSNAALTLVIESSKENQGINAWVVRTMQIPVFCPGPDLCFDVQDLKEGDYIEVEGELDAFDEEKSIAIEGKRPVAFQPGLVISALRVTKLKLSRETVGSFD